MNEFTTEWFKVGADAGVLKVEGDIDMAAGPLLRAAIREQEDQGVAVVLDLSGVHFIDSSGLRALLDASRRAAERGDSMTLRGAGPEVRRLLEITGTTGKFTMEDTP